MKVYAEYFLVSVYYAVFQIQLSNLTVKCLTTIIQIIGICVVIILVTVRIPIIHRHTQKTDFNHLSNLDFIPSARG